MKDMVKYAVFKERFFIDGRAEADDRSELEDISIFDIFEEAEAESGNGTYGYYTVTKEEIKTNENSEIEDIGIFDTYAEALREAERLSDSLIEEQMLYSVLVGRISEYDLEDKNDWQSYNKIEIIDELF